MRKALGYLAAVAMIATSGALAGPTASFAATCVGHYFQGYAHPSNLVYERVAVRPVAADRATTTCSTWTIPCGCAYN
jgi:hypothetical protein